MRILALILMILVLGQLYYETLYLDYLRWAARYKLKMFWLVYVHLSFGSIRLVELEVAIKLPGSGYGGGNHIRLGIGRH